MKTEIAVSLSGILAAVVIFYVLNHKEVQPAQMAEVPTVVKKPVAKPMAAKVTNKTQEAKVQGAEQKVGLVKVAMTADVNQDLAGTRRRIAELEQRIKERREGAENINR